MNTCVTLPERTDMQTMSFVGLCNTNEGLLAFADSRSTRVFTDGTKEIDTTRGNTPKTFQNHNFVFVTHGNNVVFDRNKEVYIENWIYENLLPNDEIDVFFNRLNFALQNNPYQLDSSYFFYVGGKDSLGYFTQQILINPFKNEFSISPKSHQKLRICGGDERYLKFFEEFVPYYYDKPIGELKEEIKTQVSACVQMFDTLPAYNPVGLPIQVEIFQ